MNKNPFVPQPSYPQQPPLPPGPPPPQPAQPDYSAYWAAAAAQHQQQQQPQPPTVGAYNPQWSAQPPRPPAEQSALYANYGYGGQQALHWQQQRANQPGQQAYAQPPPPVAQAPPPPPQPGYNPYQPTAGYQQPYVPQAGPPPHHMPVQAHYQHPPPPPQQQPMQQPPQQQFFPQHPQQQQPQQQQQQPRHNVHHTPPQQLPPAKRQRFDGPNNAHNHHHNRGPFPPPPPQPQFQPAPQPQMPGMAVYGPGQGQGNNRGGGPPGVNQMPLGGSGGRGGGGGRGGPGGGRGGRGGSGGSMGGNRGGIGGGRGGRGGSTYIGGGGRGGGERGGGPLRGHGSRGSFNNNKDYHNRRGGSFNSGGGGGHGHHQSNMGGSFRGRGQGYSGSNRGGRHDGGGGGGGTGFGARDGPMASSFTNSSGKKDENRRTLTDFKLVGLEIKDLGWTWGAVPSPPSLVKTETSEEAIVDSSQVTVKDEAMGVDAESSETQPLDRPALAVKSENGITSDVKTVAVSDVESKPVVAAPDVPVTSDGGAVTTAAIPPPPSRVRIYFHTPVSPDDSHPIPHTSTSFTGGPGATPSDSRKGKRKKLEDDDGDLEEGRGRRPPPQMSSHDDKSNVSVDMDGHGRDSVAPSVAETASVSEGDWLMAAIVEDDGEGDAEGDEDGEDDADGDTLHVSQIEDTHDVVENGHGDGGHKDMHGDMDAGNEDEDGNNHPDGSSAEAAGELVSDGPNGVVHGSETSEGADANVSTDHGQDGAAVPSSSGENNVSFVAGAQEAGASSPNIAHSNLSGPSPAGFVSVSASATATGSDPLDLAAHSEEQAADSAQSTETQVTNIAKKRKSTELQATDSLASTVHDFDAQETQPLSDDGAATIVNGSADATQGEQEVDATHGHDDDPLPEPPASPTSNTLLSTSSTSTYGETSPKVDGKSTVRTASANRLSISYAAGSRRLVIDAEIVEKLKVFRGEGRIEVLMTVDKDDNDGLKGVLIEGLSDATKSYLPLQTLSDGHESDVTLPPFSMAAIPSTTTMIIHLDTERPLSEPKWVKTGDVQEWLKSMFGRMFWVAGDAASGWERKIEVVDPDPAPTIWTVLDGWAINSPVGVQNERQRFLKTHMTEIDNILEILLRLVRGERATPFSQSAPAISAPSVSGPLLSALSQGSAHGAQQTHVSLAVLAMFRMAMEYAKKAVGDKGKTEVEERVGEIIRCLPSHLIYKSLDGIFKEWRVEKKGGR